MSEREEEEISNKNNLIKIRWKHLQQVFQVFHVFFFFFLYIFVLFFRGFLFSFFGSIEVEMKHEWWADEGNNEATGERHELRNELELCVYLR